MTAYDIKKVETMINNRPVRKFNYQTPNEVYLLKAKVALIARTQLFTFIDFYLILGMYID